MTASDIDYEAEAAKLAEVEAKTTRCVNCQDLPHAGRQCRVVRVSGRVKTQCTCSDYQPNRED